MNIIQLEEQMAEDFRDYSMTRESSGLGQKIIDLFKSFINYIKHLVTRRVEFESVASKIWRSKYSDRKLHPTDKIRNSTFDGIVYNDANGATVNVYRNTYNVEDLSIERFQRLVDSQVNNIAYNNRTKSVDMNNQWGKLVDRWKLIGVNISGHKYNGKYTVSKVELDYNNVVMRNIEQYKQNRNRTLLDEKTKQCDY